MRIRYGRQTPRFRRATTHCRLVFARLGRGPVCIVRGGGARLERIGGSETIRRQTREKAFRDRSAGRGITVSCFPVGVNLLSRTTAYWLFDLRYSNIRYAE